LHHRIVPKPGADFYLFFSPFFSASFVRAGSRLATQPGADFHEGHACCRGYGRVVPPEQPPSRFSFFKKKLSPLKGMLYRICLSCTSRIPSFEVCVCLCLCLCLCVSYKLELYLQNNLLQGFSMSYVFFRPLSPVKGMPVVSPCRIFSIFCSAHVTNLTAHPKLRRCSFMLSSTCSFYLLSALFFCRPHKPDYAFLSLYSFF